MCVARILLLPTAAAAGAAGAAGAARERCDGTNKTRAILSHTPPFEFASLAPTRYAWTRNMANASKRERERETCAPLLHVVS